MNFKAGDLPLRRRQIAFAVCCGMPDKVAAEALGIEERSFSTMKSSLIHEMGYDSPMEFLLNVNAAVRDAFRRSWAN